MRRKYGVSPRHHLKSQNQQMRKKMVQSMNWKHSISQMPRTHNKFIGSEFRLFRTQADSLQGRKIYKLSSTLDFVLLLLLLLWDNVVHSCCFETVIVRIECSRMRTSCMSTTVQSTMCMCIRCIFKRGKFLKINYLSRPVIGSLLII